jgi:two-component system, response regulator YesN
MSKEFRFTLAEDDENFLFLLHHALSTAFPGSNLSTFTNAEDALSHIQNSGADIIITNHGMGAMSGTEMIRTLRKQGYTLPIIMVSGSEDAEREARDAGATEFIHKDIALKRILSEVRKLLGVR